MLKRKAFIPPRIVKPPCTDAENQCQAPAELQPADQDSKKKPCTSQPALCQSNRVLQPMHGMKLKPTGVHAISLSGSSHAVGQGKAGTTNDKADIKAYFKVLYVKQVRVPRGEWES